MNLHDQIGALEAGVDQLLVAATASTSRAAEAACADQPATAHADTTDTTGVTLAHAGQPQAQAEVRADVGHAQPAVNANAGVDAAESTDTAETVFATETAVESTPEAATPAQASATQPDESAGTGPTLEINRPSQNVITMTIGDQTVSLHPLQVGQLIEELANARASMQPEPPPGIPPGWRFASTKNPAMAVQKQSNGDRLLVLRHTGHGWVPFTFSPDMVVQMYMMLTQR
ncbi:hypothetical protein [Paraburkholderia dinghuensis]|uniref:Phage tail protein n=1 Tax=Paraburkholderia dinghuensis TaxID=2305225 RepID=A0A3N6MQ51_9BURK|nr:hypothetical protein [Paraburkholderia dinghuensis]RQH03925.1 hypothetical protein D1Y85_20025 [Paraburkholderia dinghuensis]